MNVTTQSSQLKHTAWDDRCKAHIEVQSEPSDLEKFPVPDIWHFHHSPLGLCTVYVRVACGMHVKLGAGKVKVPLSDHRKLSCRRIRGCRLQWYATILLCVGSSYHGPCCGSVEYLLGLVPLQTTY